MTADLDCYPTDRDLDEEHEAREARRERNLQRLERRRQSTIRCGTPEAAADAFCSEPLWPEEEEETTP